MLLILDSKKYEFYKKIVATTKNSLKQPIHAMIKPLIRVFFYCKNACSIFFVTTKNWNFYQITLY
jgi:hypothetical protein